MNLKTAKSQLGITKAEQESLGLLGENNTKVLQMVALMNFTVDTIANMQKKGIPVPSTKEEISELINHIANIYSAAYKSKDDYVLDTLYKDGNKATSTFTYIPGQFILSNRDLSQAKQIKGEAVKFNLAPDLPKINIGQYLQENGGYETLFLIPPFVRYTYDEQSVEDDVSAIYDVSRRDLPDMPEAVYKEFSDRLLNGIDSFLGDVKKSRDYDAFEKYLLYRADAPETTAAERAQALTDVRSKWREKNVINNRIQDYYFDMRTLIQATCKEREKDYDLAVETVQEQDPEYYDKFVEKRNQKLTHDKTVYDYQQYTALTKQIGQAQADLISSLTEMYRSFSTAFKKHNEMFTEFGLPFKDKRRIYSMLSKFADVKLGAEKKFAEPIVSLQPTDGLEAIDAAKQTLSNEMQGIQDSLDIISRENNTNYFDLDRQNSFRKEIYFKANETIRAYSVQYLSRKVQNLASKKVGLFGLFNGEEALRHEQMTYYGSLLQLVKEQQPQEQSSYSLRNTLSDLYIATHIDMPDFPTEDLVSLYARIRDRFKIDENILIGQDVQQKLKERSKTDTTTALVTVPEGTKISNRELASRFKFGTDELQRKFDEEKSKGRTFDEDFLPSSNESIENINRSLNKIMANLEIDVERSFDPTFLDKGSQYYDKPFTTKLSSRTVNPEDINPQVNDVRLDDYDGQDIEINM